MAADVPRLDRSSLHPKHWGMWLLMGIFFSISLIPYSIQGYLARGIGRIAKLALPKRVKIARRNLQLCFPELSNGQIDDLVDENFQHVGYAITDTANAWFWPQWRFERKMEVQGLENLEAARQKPGGLLAISLHFLSLETHARAHGSVEPGVGVYRPNKSPVYDYFQFHGRVRKNCYLVDRNDIRGMIKALRDGLALWYAPDHDYGHKASCFAPFFNVEKANTVTGTSTLAKVKNCQVLPTYTIRKPNNQGFTLIIEPVIENFPTGDELADATIINQHIETIINRAPAQYMWMHRRFKTRPEGEPSLYD
ncbi:LpxL/LpxP family Kdo(2)-lipid IV(A) lauroyl/palmitoleoyl acyltransferase [Alginatibacterium sediminis]|uniref:Lipid A biosynthesis acyltransferase n=1 Tax=Alginatibacterium sediminis TaxID=2164068 RepID=A0A420ECJ5_9ALTE|nr:LpxL/LpxP family Kdo(2)-lipid IV(A) lauroyl/palmitoleoyl acyltransferase [Alginatibacterium sediminis]RKF18449.1 LpxL/LpxP family Kdo(2)-lipid IV(A) lauroyl/palmitoleoyl acyltransferase [Alginatibacterium sediminis]